MVSTADVKDIDDVIKELLALLVKRLPGGDPIKAAWATVNEASRMITHARYVLDSEDASDVMRWRSHGEIYATTTIVRKVADAFRVSNLKPGTKL